MKTVQVHFVAGLVALSVGNGGPTLYLSKGEANKIAHALRTLTRNPEAGTQRVSVPESAYNFAARANEAAE